MGEHSWAEIIGMFVISIGKFIFTQLDKILIFFGGGGIAVFSKWLMTKIRNRRLKKVEERLEDLSSIYASLKTIITKTNYKTAIIFKGHNGTGIPEPGKAYKVTSLYAEHTDLNRSLDLQGKYTSLQVGHYCIDRLLEVCKHKDTSTFMNTRDKEVPVGSVLDSILKAENCSFSELRFIAVNDKELIFILLGAENEADFRHTQIPEFKNRVNIEVAKIKKIFSPYYS